MFLDRVVLTYHRRGRDALSGSMERVCYLQPLTVTPNKCWHVDRWTFFGRWTKKKEAVELEPTLVPDWSIEALSERWEFLFLQDGRTQLQLHLIILFILNSSMSWIQRENKEYYTFHRRDIGIPSCIIIYFWNATHVFPRCSEAATDWQLITASDACRCTNGLIGGEVSLLFSVDLITEPWFDRSYRKGKKNVVVVVSKNCWSRFEPRPSFGSLSLSLLLWKSRRSGLTAVGGAASSEYLPSYQSLQARKCWFIREVDLFMVLTLPAGFFFFFSHPGFTHTGRLLRTCESTVGRITINCISGGSKQMLFVSPERRYLWCAAGFCSGILPVPPKWLYFQGTDLVRTNDSYITDAVLQLWWALGEGQLFWLLSEQRGNLLTPGSATNQFLIGRLRQFSISLRSINWQKSMPAHQSQHRTDSIQAKKRQKKYYLALCFPCVVQSPKRVLDESLVQSIWPFIFSPTGLFREVH